MIRGRIAPSQIPALCERARTLVEGMDAEIVICDVGALREPDGTAVDALARLQLTARRCGHGIRLRHACEGLRELLELSGLTDAVPLYVESDLEMIRQPEQREEASGVEEERDAGDLSL